LPEVDERGENRRRQTIHAEERPMPPETPAEPTVGDPITDLTDPRALTILTTEHWSQLSARSLAYNEAFTRGGMFLTFLSASLVALALFAQGMSFGDQFLTIAALVLAFDFVIGLATYARISGANVDDLRAMHAMARLRHGYVQAAPSLERYFTSPVHDDIDSVVLAYGAGPQTSGLSLVLYGLTTSGGMIGIVVSMVGGVLAGVLALMVVSEGLAIWIGLAGAVITFSLIVLLTVGTVPRHQAGMTALFPAPGAAASTDQ
jgi:hypothetical protein